MITLTPEQWVFAAGVLFLCGMLQSAVGFAFTLIALPLLVMLKLPLAETVALTTVGSMAQRMMAVSQLRQSVNWRDLLPLIGAGMLMLPVGVLILAFLSKQRQDLVQQIVGVLILTVLAVQWGVRVQPRERVGAGWGFGAAALSGVLNGFGNIGGPPIILWIHAHNWPTARLRATPMAFTLPMAPIQLLLQWLKFGPPILSAILCGAMLIPVVLAGGSVGLYLGKRMPTPVLRAAVFTLLLILGVSAVIKPWLPHR